MKLEKGLMTILYNHLVANKKATRDELRMVAFNNKFDMGTADRKLRDLKKFGYVSQSKGSKGFINEYRIIDTKQADLSLKSNVLTATPSRCATLDDKLREILERTSVIWGDPSNLRELLKALESKNNLTKEAVIRKYEQ